LISTPWSLQSLTHTGFGRWKVKIAQGLGWGREGGDGEGEEQSNCEKKEWARLTAVKRYLYLYDPESPDQVRTIRETRTFREKSRRLHSPRVQRADLQGIWFWIALEDCICNICEPEQYQHIGLATNKQ
jgi:hypothetical protein